MQRSFPFARRLLLRLMGVSALAFSSGSCATTRNDQSISAPKPTVASAAKPTVADERLQTRLAEMDRVIDAKRKELHVPGLALAVVRDGAVLHMRGYGFRELEGRSPVTPRTTFAIGSSTKAFTALATLIAVDDGKISLNDSPKTCVPYMKLSDPEADAKITIRDLLIHSSGLGRTDESWIYGDLTREEAIKIAGFAKPLVKLREAWNYQNTMYAVAGECAARAEGMRYEALVERRILAPLGMRSTSTTLEGLKNAEDRAIGYEPSHGENGRPDGVIPAWLMDLSAIAPAGSINSNVEDMAKWVAFLLRGGKDPQIVSPSHFAELMEPQIGIAAKREYALGWFIDDWRGHRRVHHGGNVAGFTAMVAMLPEHDIGYVMLANLSATPIAQTVGEAVFSLVLDDQAARDLLASLDPGELEPGASSQGDDPRREVGTYQIDVTPTDSLLAAVTWESGSLRLAIPGQPTYELLHVAGREYKFTPPESSHEYVVTFRQNRNDRTQVEAYVQQPGGNHVLRRVDDDPARGLAAFEPPAQDVDAMRELLGIYEAPKQRLGVAPRIRIEDGRVVLSGLGGARGLSLVRAGEDQYGLHGASRMVIRVTRDVGGKVSGFELDLAGQQIIELVRAGDLPPEHPAPELTVEQLMSKVVRAHGAQHLAKRRSLRIRARTTREGEGMSVDVTISRRAPNELAIRERYQALGKTIMQVARTFDGQDAVVEMGKYEPRKLRGRARRDLAILSDFNPIQNWRTLFSEVEIRGTTVVDGEKAYVVEKRPRNGSLVTEYVSAETFLVLRRDRRQPSASAVEEERFEDYRRVRGVMIPFRTITGAGATRAVTEVLEVQMDVEIPNAELRPSRPVHDRAPLQVAIDRRGETLPLVGTHGL